MRYSNDSRAASTSGMEQKIIVYQDRFGRPGRTNLTGAKALIKSPIRLNDGRELRQVYYQPRARRAIVEEYDARDDGSGLAVGRVYREIAGLELAELSELIHGLRAIAPHISEDVR